MFAFMAFALSMSACPCAAVNFPELTKALTRWPKSHYPHRWVAYEAKRESLVYQHQA